MGNNASSNSSSSSHKQHSASGGHETRSAASSQRKEAKSHTPRHHLNKTPTPSPNTTRSGATATRSINNAVHVEDVTAEIRSASPGISTVSKSSPSNPTQALPIRQDIPSKPVPITAGATAESASARSQSRRSSLESSSVHPSTQDMSYHLTRPPRLPLPIEEEVHTPGSPIIPPADSDAPPLDLDASENEGLTRKGSQTSNTTVNSEDEDGELQLDKTRAVVPTLVEWIGGNPNSKVYVTGSIFSWNKKQRLHPDPNRPGVFSANVHVRPGTHHLNFLIDGVMTTSTHLPTTVDFNNHLVNYIEVSPDDIPKPPSAPSSPKTSSGKKPPPTQKMKPTIPSNAYTSVVPGYLEDLELPEESEAYQRVAAAIEKLPPPPSLPGFLGKPILNAATPMKDDNSVLVFPNHTVLNHLATSSIKNGVLAVSATTRYKKKYVTTIMYKPT